MRGKIFGLALFLPCFALYADPPTVTYIYSDTQGTPLAEADANGNVTATFDYRPYGKIALGTSLDGPGYTGHVNDSSTGLTYMQARYYDSNTARFLSVDPDAPDVGKFSNFNRYAYAAANPIGNIDPDGKDILVIAGGRNTGSLNAFGHIASSVQGFGVASYGNATPLGSSTVNYIQSQSTLRTQVITVVPTTPEQDDKATNFIQTQQNDNSAGLIDNCAVKTNLILNSAGVSTNGVPFPGGTSRDVSSLPGAKTYTVPQNGQIPQQLQNILTHFDDVKPKTPPPPPPPPKIGDGYPEKAGTQ